MGGNIVLRYIRNSIVQKTKNPHYGTSILGDPFAMFMLIGILLPVLFTIMVFTVVLVPLNAYSDIILKWSLLLSLVAGVISWAIFMKKESKRIKTLAENLKNELDCVEQKIKNYDEKATNNYTNAIVRRCDPVEKYFTSLYSLDVELDTGEVLKDLISIELPVLKYVHNYDIGHYEISHLSVNDGSVVELLEDKQAQEERVKQEELF